MSNVYHVHKWLSSELPDWQKAQSLYVNQYLWISNEYQPHVEVKLCYTDESLHLQFRVYEENPTIRHYHMNEAVYEDSCAEFFVQPLPETDERYLNFEFNAAGTLLLGLGKDRNDRVRLSNVEPEWFQIQTVRDIMDPIKYVIYWELSFSIPFAWIQRLFPNFLPQPQTILKANFYKCGDKTPIEHYGSWNKVLSETPDFHRSCDFGELILE